jgi:hypothetical protein
MPRLYGGFALGSLTVGKTFVEESPFTVSINAGYIVNKKLSFDARYMTLIPESIIYKNNEFSEDPFYKSYNFIDFTGHYNLISNLKTRYKMETLLATNKVEYSGKIPKKFSDNLSLDIGANHFNFYNATQLNSVKNANFDLVNQTRIGNISYTSAKLGLSYLRTESRKFKVDWNVNERAKHKRFYAFLTNAVNSTYDIIYSEYKYVSNTRKTDKEMIDNTLVQKPKIDPLGFRLGFEGTYFFPGKVNFFAVLGLEIGTIPTMEFSTGHKTTRYIVMGHVGFGLFDKIHMK